MDTNEIDECISTIRLDFVELFEKFYIINHIKNEYIKNQKEKIYKIYTAECLRLITENSAKIAGGNYMTAKYQDIIEPKQEIQQTAEEIIDEFMKKWEEAENEFI